MMDKFNKMFNIKEIPIDNNFNLFLDNVFNQTLKKNNIKKKEKFKS